jgi:hypothetical protein
VSLRQAINQMCRECNCDPLDRGTANQQIAACVAESCPLRPVRPIARGTKPEQLDERARALIVTDTASSAPNSRSTEDDTLERGTKAGSP